MNPKNALNFIKTLKVHFKLAIVTHQPTRNAYHDHHDHSFLIPAAVTACLHLILSQLKDLPQSVIRSAPHSVIIHLSYYNE